eukprot:748585-Hanusia_phi.AAC.1
MRFKTTCIFGARFPIITVKDGVVGSDEIEVLCKWSQALELVLISVCSQDRTLEGQKKTLVDSLMMYTGDEKVRKIVYADVHVDRD